MKRCINIYGPLLLFLIILLVGCSEKSNFEIIGNDPKILIHNLSGGMEAEVTGTVIYDEEHKFILLQDEEGNDISIPIWPQGTTAIVEGDVHGVEIPKFGKLIEGESVKASGGGIENDELSDLNIPEQYKDANFKVISTMTK